MKYALKPWITPGIIRSIKYRNKLQYKLNKLNPINHLYRVKEIHLKNYKKRLRKLVNAVKNDYFKHKLEEFKNDSRNTWDIINSLLRNKNKASIPDIMIDEGGKKIQGKLNISNKFNDYFLNITKDIELNGYNTNTMNIEKYLTKKVESQFKFNRITEQELDALMLMIKSKPSRGFDNISTYILKKTYESIKGPLLYLVNNSLESGIFPNCFKIAKIVPIFKKENDKYFSNYRPISILPAFSKIFEKCVSEQLHLYFTQNKFLSFSQYGFQKNCSTETAAIEFVDNIKQEIGNKHIPLAIFLDLSKAFDTVNHSILLRKLGHYGIRDTELSWFKSYLSNRKQFVEIDGTESDTKIIKSGVPQGSILGPLLFLIYINDLNDVSKFFKAIFYADDSTLICSLCFEERPSKFHKLCLKGRNDSFINNELNKIVVWLQCNKLKLNIKKTKYMLFHNPQRRVVQEMYPRITIDGNEIEKVEEFNFLGIIINSHCNWNNHIATLSKKISKNIGLLSKLRYILSKHCLKLIYFALIQSYLNYGILLWGFEAQKLFRLQKKAIRIITKSNFLAHTDPLFKKRKNPKD